MYTVVKATAYGPLSTDFTSDGSGEHFLPFRPSTNVM